MNKLASPTIFFASVLVTGVFLSCSLPAQATAQEGNAALPVAFRTRVATHYRLPDGKLRAEITLRPHNYRDAAGQWHAIDTALVEGNHHAFVNLTNGLTSRYSSVAGEGVVFEGINQPALVMTPLRFAGYDNGGFAIGESALRTATATLHGTHTVHYAEVFHGVTDEYIVDTDRVKHNLVLKREAVAAFENSASIGGEFALQIPEGLSVQFTDGSRAVRLLNESGECIYELGPVIAYDASGESAAGNLGARAEGRTLYVTMTAPAAWINDSKRAWPIRIDPTLSLQPDAVTGKDTHVRSGGPTTNYGNGTSIGSNYGSTSGPLHVMIQFDLTSIPTTGTVSTAQFELWHWSNTVTGNSFDVYEITAAWQETVVTWNTKPTAAASISTSLVYPSGSGTWRTYTGMATLSQGWVSNPSSNNGFYIINATQDYFNAYHYSSDYASVNERPKYTADYITNVAPTIELPTSGTAFTGSMAAGFTANVPPAALSNLNLELLDADADPIDVVSVTVVPSAPGGITAPAPSTANPTGTIVSFTGNGAQAVPGTYTWTITIDDGFGPVVADASITVADETPTNAAGPHAPNGDGSIANPYTGEVGLGGMSVLDLATVTDPNIPQTLTQVSVTPDGGNPSSLFQVAYSGTGNSGGISATPTGVVTYLDIGDHVFTVTVTDGNSTLDVVVRVTVLNAGNTQPTAVISGTFAGTQNGGFTLSVNPGETLSAANILIADADADDIEVLSVQVVPAAGMLGVTGPAPSAAAPGPFSISWTGTADASEVPGDFVYTIMISDGITPPISFTATITLTDVPPQHVPSAGVTGDGSVALPYAFITQVGKTPAFDACNVADQNLSQTVTLVSVTPDPLNPTGGAGFDVALTGQVLSVNALGTLKSDDVGTHVFTANLTDGTNNIQVVMRVKVNTVAGDKPENGGCSGTTGSSVLWLLLVLGGALAATRIRMARE